MSDSAFTSLPTVTVAFDVTDPYGVHTLLSLARLGDGPHADEFIQVVELAPESRAVLRSVLFHELIEYLAACDADLVTTAVVDAVSRTVLLYQAN